MKWAQIFDREKKKFVEVKVDSILDFEEDKFLADADGSKKKYLYLDVDKKLSKCQVIYLAGQLKALQGSLISFFKISFFNLNNFYVQILKKL